jgi:hypothetical protein
MVSQPPRVIPPRTARGATLRRLAAPTPIPASSRVLDGVVSEADEPTGPTVVDPPYTWEAFRSASQRFARSAAANYAPSEAPFFYLHSGAGLELAVKSVLCKLNPILLVESQRVSDPALLRLVGIEPRQRAAASSGRRTRDSAFPYTVGFTKAKERLDLIYGRDVLGVGADFDELKAARDLTAHGGAIASDVSRTMHRVLVALARAIEQLLPLLDTTPEEFWGESSPMIARVLENQQDAVRAQIDTLYSAAQRRFDERYEGVPPEGLDELQHETYWRLAERNEESRQCPVCGSRGMSHVRAELRQELDARGRPRLVPGFLAIDFRCPICNLILEDEQLVQTAKRFDAWEPEPEGLELDYWLEAFGPENLDTETLVALGFEGASWSEDTPAGDD